jgi:hypothetical protein
MFCFQKCNRECHCNLSSAVGHAAPQYAGIECIKVKNWTL